MARLRALVACCLALWAGCSRAMPPPPSYLDITSLTYTQTVTQADFNGGTYGGVANETWFRFVTSATTIIGIHIDQGGTYTPHIQVYKSDGSTLIVQASNATLWVPLDTSTFYIRVRNSTGFGSSDFDWTINVYNGTILTSVPRGSMVINDDSEISGSDPFSGSPYPATVWDTSGSFLGFLLDIPAGEIGDALPSGISLWHARFDSAGNRLKLFDANGQLSVSTDNSVGTATNSVLMCNDGTQFFVAKSTGVIFNVSNTGTVSSTIATITGLGSSLQSIGVNRAGTVLYYTVASGSTIKRWNLSTDTAMSDLYSAPAGTDDIASTAVNFNPGELIVLSDDSLVTWYVDYGTTPDTYVIVHLDSSGSVLHSYTLSSGLYVDHIHYSAAGSTSVNVWYFRNSSDSTSRLGTLDITTGTLSPTFDIDNFSSSVSRVTAGSIYFGPSASCTMVTLGYGGGQIDVVKVTSPSGSSQSFDFTAGGGLSPSTFSLTDGQTQSFTGLSDGSGYSISETVPAGWSASFSISSGDPPNNITISGGNTVTVTVTNTQATAGSPSSVCCASSGPGGAPPSTGFSGNGATNPTVTPTIVPSGGAPPSYAMCNIGGGTPATASDPTDSQNFATAKTPRFYLKMTVGDGTFRYYGKHAFTSGAGHAVTARVVRWGSCAQVLSDRHGSFQAMSYTVTLSDYDRALRTILSTSSTQHIDGKDAVIYGETAANAALSVAPLVISRGIITNWKWTRDLELELTVTDPLGYRYSSVSLDRQIPQRLCRQELFPQLPEQNSGRPMPIIYGEYSDDYAWSLNPSRLPVGILPVIHVGPANSISATGISGSQWEAFLVAGHAITCVQSVFGSNGATSPGSVRLSTSQYGVDVLVPGVNVPLYYDITGTDGVTERVCLMFATGTVADDHITGRVPITINPQGIEDVGDGSGDTITEMALQFQHFLQHWIVSNYLTGSWGSVPTFGDGTAKVRTSSFTTVNNIHKARLGRSTGYSGRMYIGPDQKPAREWNKEWMISGDMRLGVNHHGQLVLVTVNDTGSLVGLTTYTDRDHIIQDSFEVSPNVDDIFNIYTYDYGVEPATGRKSGLAQTIRDTTSITNHGQREAQALTFMATAEKATANDVARRTLASSINAPTDVQHDLDLRGVTQTLGGMYRVTHYQGIGTTGWTSRVLMNTRITTLPDEDAFSTTIEAEDVHDRLTIGSNAFIINTSLLGTGTII